MFLEWDVACDGVEGALLGGDGRGVEHAQRLSRRMDNHLCGWRVIFLVEAGGCFGVCWFLLR